MRTILLGLLLIVGLAIGPWACSENPDSIVAPNQSAAPLSNPGSLEKGNVILVTATQSPIEITNPGEVKFVGARMIIKGMEFREQMTSDSPYMQGIVIITMNASFDANQEGPFQGKWTIYPEADLGGVWEGTWEGYQKLTGSNDLISNVIQVGKGKGGTIDGMQCFARSIYINGFGTIEATIRPH